MTIKIWSLLIALFTMPSVYAQDAQADKEIKQAITELAFITGNWAGEGWMMGNNGKKYYFKQTEKLQFKLDSTVLLIEGLGKDGEKVIHDALAIVTYNNKEKSYHLRSYLSTGADGYAKAELKDAKFYWYPNDNMHYIIYLNEKGQWYETGEIKKGNEWVQFFEMVLDRVGK